MNNASMTTPTLQRQYRGYLICDESAYYYVLANSGAICYLTALGSGYSSWYLYNHDGKLFVLDKAYNSDIIHFRPAPSRFDLTS